MKNSNRKNNNMKSIAAAFGIAIIGSMNANAAPTFPGQHNDSAAQFVESTVASTIDFSGPYYRPAADSGRAAMNEYASRSGEHVAVAAVGITPRYLSNN